MLASTLWAECEIWCVQYVLQHNIKLVHFEKVQVEALSMFVIYQNYTFEPQEANCNVVVIYCSITYFQFKDSIGEMCFLTLFCAA